MALVSKSVLCTQDDTPENQFANLLTPYAQQFVIKQLSLRRKVKFATNQEGEDFIILSREGTLMVSGNLCHCKFATTMKLPYHHVFAVRDKLGLPLYASDSIAERWKLTYLKEVFGNKRTTSVESCSYEVACADFGSVDSSCCAMSQHQKFAKAKKVVEKLPSLASEVGMKEFAERINVLQCIHDIWARGRKVIVVEDDDDDVGFNDNTNAVFVDGVEAEEVFENDVGNKIEVGGENEVEIGYCDIEDVLDVNLTK